MIQRIKLPNLANQNTIDKRTRLSLWQENHNQKEYQKMRKSNAAKGSNSINKSNEFSTLKKGSRKQNQMKTQASTYSSNNTQRLKPHKDLNIFHTKPQTQVQAKQKKTYMSSYFFKVHNSLNILENTEDLKQKLAKAKQQQETERRRMASIQTSKKKLQKKIIVSPEKNATKSVDNLEQKNHLPSKVKKIQATARRQIKAKTEHSEIINLSMTLENRKQAITKNAKQAKYSFEHFNSGEIFHEIAEINEKKLLLQSDYTKGFGTLTNRMYQAKDKISQRMIRQQFEQDFRDQYNTFLRNKLPPSFGQNGKKSCIYEQYVLRRKEQQQNRIKSKVTEGKFLRTQPSNSQRQQFIFTNEIEAISMKKLHMDAAFIDKLREDENKVYKSKSVYGEQNRMRNDTSMGSSKIPSHGNSKLNTLRQGQSFLNKLKLKKLAKQQEKEKQRLLKKKSPLKIKTKSRNGNSSLSNYENTLAANQLAKLIEKSNQILGSHVVHEEQKNDTKDLNEFEQQHLANIDRLLCKQHSLRREDKEDLDCLPWRIAIKTNEKRRL